VDHIHDLTLGGDDNSAQMIALCPNCHQIKNRGSTRELVSSMLFATAKLRHESLAGPGMEDGPGRGVAPIPPASDLDLPNRESRT
jgi:hypothetical protein